MMLHKIKFKLNSSMQKVEFKYNLINRIIKGIIEKKHGKFYTFIYYNGKHAIKHVLHEEQISDLKFIK